MGADILLRCKSVAPDGLSELYIASDGNVILCFCAGIGDQPGLFQMNEIAFSHVFLRGVDADDLPEKHIVASKRYDLFQPAFRDFVHHNTERQARQGAKGAASIEAALASLIILVCVVLEQTFDDRSNVAC